MSTQSLAAAKAHFSALVESVVDTHERVTVTRNGVPAVVVVSVDDLASLEETLEILRDEATMAQLAVAEAEFAAGDTVSLDELRQALAERHTQA